MSRIVALSLTYAALSGAAVQSAANASFGRYTEEQLAAWWDANVAQPRPGCGAYRCAKSFLGDDAASCARRESRDEERERAMAPGGHAGSRGCVFALLRLIVSLQARALWKLHWNF